MGEVPCAESCLYIFVISGCAMRKTRNDKCIMLYTALTLYEEDKKLTALQLVFGLPGSGIE
jgi:hypothetical protein